ncbi:MAG: protein kinase domain-containing protein [Planctomycetales bacterium]
MADHPRVSVDRLRQIDTLCDQYESAWRAGRSPRLEEFISDSAFPHDTHLLAALLRLDAELRGETLNGGLVAKYHRRFPHSSAAIQRAFPDVPPVPSSFWELTPPLRVPVDDPPPAALLSMSPHTTAISLEVTDGPHAGARFQFAQHDTLIAGRAEIAQLRLQNDPHFSRHHFRLEFNPPMCYLLDLGSRNGTSVNGRKVKECFLKNGDIISGGRTKIRFNVTGGMEATLDEPVAPVPLPPLASPSPPPGDVAQDQLPTPPAALPIGGGSPPHSSPESLVPTAAKNSGTPLIPGYELHEELGRGAMGAVYRAVQKASGRECAVKVLTPAQISGDKSLQLFLREVSILSQLKHRRIVRFLELGSAGRTAFFAMECVPAVPFEELVAGRSLMSRVQVVCGIACQVLDALEYAHGLELVHRDIKPANILLTKQSSKLSVKLADFGLAKCFTNAGFSEVSRDGDICGSLAYMAPEQLINSRQARPSCDLYSLGATLYRYLSGENMFNFQDGPCKFLVVLEEQPIPLLERCPDLPEELAAIIHKSLAKNPDDRHASARHMREAIEALLRKLKR